MHFVIVSASLLQSNFTVIVKIILLYYFAIYLQIKQKTDSTLFHFRDAKAQEVLWKYSLEKLDDKVSQDLVNDMTITADDLERELEEK